MLQADDHMGQHLFSARVIEGLAGVVVPDLQCGNQAAGGERFLVAVEEGAETLSLRVVTSWGHGSGPERGE